VVWMCVLKEVGPTIKEKVRKSKKDNYPSELRRGKLQISVDFLYIISNLLSPFVVVFNVFLSFFFQFGF